MSPQTENLFLSRLSPAARDFLITDSTALELPRHTVLYEVGCVPRYAYFLFSGLASILTPMSNHEAAEAGFIGHEGIVGSLQLLGPACLSTRCTMRLTGNGLKIPFSLLQKAFDAFEEVRNRILEFCPGTGRAGRAACRVQPTAQRRGIVHRWLLMAQDRTQFNALTFTQDCLAEMIGSQRAPVTLLAGDTDRNRNRKGS